MLAEDAAVAVLARAGVIAARVAAGGAGPREYYATETEWVEAVLRARLRR